MDQTVPSDDDKSPLLRKETNGENVDTTQAIEIKVYPSRLYVLFLFSAAAFLQAMVWNAFGPIASSAKHVFSWSNGDIAMLANVGAIAFASTCLFSSWVMDVKGKMYTKLVSHIV